ncbi:acyl-CoA dehydrogenase [Stenotrophomonas maltophilia]|uniref:acyl-CoA dehydrogenase n=1 Tax=Stenotrophomonas maltophilia TaxID=40324 RepID=UPI0015DEDF1A|nr:acyl-CoA dehydrogenase [Stenotrophomonas maltophilia]MBA0389713.1 acyl-CoA dehydrogenase [Stenotrophomonas maltophilia]MBA0390252.1 acyl-CoA dehydrogenase [Stenotrophomonas maltophilia]MBA0464154.1 acyl-CoA dehydrogenase [Stenotrophomonas maltophilia]MBA0471295.1 acyl-CoA dehydrogenase [Stenotrophomonas maltophilia]
MQDVMLPSSLFNRARQVLAQQPALPLPGSGHTLQRWRALAAWGAEDLCLAKVLEAHYDAQAIIAELNAPVVAEGQLLAVWAAEGPANTLRIDAGGGLYGDKPWCSGSAWVDAALVTVRNTQGMRLCHVAAEHWCTLSGEPWPATGMAGIPSTTVRFDGAPMTILGARDAYLQRPGFWHGGAGIAAVWFGAAVALAERMRPACSDGNRARLLGAVDLALGPAAALLREVAARIDDAPQSAHREDVVRLRCVVERAATRVLDLAGRALGPAPMCLEDGHARRWADLTVFLRQCHADRDWQWLGEQRAAEETAWAL